MAENKLSVVMYHYVRDLKNSRYPEIKGCDVRLFKEQIRFLKKHYNFVTIEEVIDAWNSKKQLPPHAVLLTFDDAYKDHFDYVFPILEHEHIQRPNILQTKENLRQKYTKWYKKRPYLL